MRQLLPLPARSDPPLDEVYAWPDGRCVRVNFVASIDGAATVAGRSGGLSSAADKAVFHHLRASCDVVLIGAGTARAENYRPARVPIAVVTNRLSLHVDDRLFGGDEGTARPIVLTAKSAEADRRLALVPVADVVEVGDAEVDLGLAVAELAGRGFQRILCEGGPSLFGHLLDRHLVDELCVTIAPTLVAGSAPRIAHGAAPPSPSEATLLAALEEEGELLLRYSLG